MGIENTLIILNIVLLNCFPHLPVIIKIDLSINPIYLEIARAYSGANIVKFGMSQSRSGSGLHFRKSVPSLAIHFI